MRKSSAKGASTILGYHATESRIRQDQSGIPRSRWICSTLKADSQSAGTTHLSLANSPSLNRYPSFSSLGNIDKIIQYRYDIDHWLR
jgi:hypothetical protein